MSFSSLIVMARTSKTILNKSGESGHPHLVPHLRGNTFSFPPLRLILVWTWHLWHLLCWGRSPLCSLSRGFLSKQTNKQKRMLNFIKRLFWIYWDYHRVFILLLVNVGCHTDLCILKKPWIPRINPIWPWCVILLMYV